MSSYSGPYSPRRDDSFDERESERINLDDHWITTDVSSEPEDRSKKRTHAHPLVVVGVITDVIVLIAVFILEYFLRWTNYFPYRKHDFNCTDPAINFKKSESLCDDFTIQGDVQWLIILVTGVCLPPIVILPCEVIVWWLNWKQCKEKKIRICGKFDLSQVARRIMRNIATFAFGALSTLAIVDVIKIMVGKLRPRFMELCEPKQCSTQTTWTAEVCSVTADGVRWASTSFPSMRTALISFCAIYLSVYLHAIMASRGKSLTTACISLLLVMGIFLCGWSQVCNYDNDWIDVVAGGFIGTAVAFYLSIQILRGFEFRERISKRELGKKLNLLLAVSHENRNSRKLIRPYPYFHDSSQNLASGSAQPLMYGNGIPRPIVSRPDSSLGGARTGVDPRQNTFQRDLLKTIDQYRRTTSPEQWNQHM